tara:strand:+ start:24 stop:641 length:618 start_codon:yes stop_codon:yes gene_type:complete
MIRKATNIFSEWASIGKDEGMQINHWNAVKKMFQLLNKDQSQPFSFIDAGCGNGWAVREMLKNPLCLNAVGVDGAIKMIEKAKKTDPSGNYVCKDLMEWEPKTLADMVHSMEVVYYFNDPKKLISHMKNKWLKPNGKLILGLDFYKENIDCHNWPNKLNTKMTLLSIKEWIQLLKNCGLKDVISYQTNSTDSFEGTLLLYAKKLD